MITVKEVVQKEMSWDPVLRLGHTNAMVIMDSSKEEVDGNGSHFEIIVRQHRMKSADKFRPKCPTERNGCPATWMTLEDKVLMECCFSVSVIKTPWPRQVIK